MSPPTGLPRVDAYLASLPDGLASYPDIVQKASVYREFIRFLPTSAAAGKLPAPVEALLTKPVPASAWVPEVHVTTLFLGIVDTGFTKDEEFIARALIANKELLTGPLYRLLMMVASPAYLARNAEARWNTFHRGIKMVTESLPEGKSGSAQFRLEYPKKLLPDLLARSYTTAFQAALEAAGARGVVVEVVRYDDEACTFKCTWA
jgi:hypothetical protein